MEQYKIFFRLAVLGAFILELSAFPTPGIAEAPPLPELRAELVASGFVEPTYILGFSQPTPATLLVVEQRGTVRRIDGLEPAVGEPILDLTSKVAAGGERGLLSIAFHPRFSENQLVYVNYTAEEPKLKTVIAELRYVPALGKVDIKSERRLLEIDQPYSNHNGGQIAFGPDKMLYIGMGDGGAAFDPHNNAQQRENLLGDILRIDPNAKPYAVPADNPFVGTPALKPEIWAWGLRNPWRFSFDRESGHLFTGDVGQNSEEEINLIQKGANYGWKILEGHNCLETRFNCLDAKFVAPIVTYGRQDGFSVTGGYVYRGKELPGLRGVYLYGDFGSGKIWGFRYEKGKATTPKLLLQSEFAISTFGEDLAGELYVADYRTGKIYRLRTASS